MRQFEWYTFEKKWLHFVDMAFDVFVSLRSLCLPASDIFCSGNLFFNVNAHKEWHRLGVMSSGYNFELVCKEEMENLRGTGLCCITSTKTISM